MTGAGAGVGAETGARASRTALRICCKSSLESLETLIIAVENFGLRGLSGYLEISDSGGGEKPEETIEEATKRRS